jgi:hypothetical protein
MRAKMTAVLAVAAGTLAGASGASAGDAVVGSCHTVEEPWLYSYVTVCASTGQEGTTVAPSAGVGCGIGGRPICDPLFTPIEVGKSGQDEYGRIWIDGTRFIGP